MTESIHGTTGHGSGVGPLLRGQRIRNESDISVGDVLIDETDAWGGCVNVIRVTRLSSSPSVSGFYGHFVDPHDVSKKRLPTDQEFFVWWPPLAHERLYHVATP